VECIPFGSDGLKPDCLPQRQNLVPTTKADCRLEARVVKPVATIFLVPETARFASVAEMWINTRDRINPIE
jgi:hypothetical protein